MNRIFIILMLTFCLAGYAGKGKKKKVAAPVAPCVPAIVGQLAPEETARLEEQSLQARFFGNSLSMLRVRRDLARLTGARIFCDGQVLKDRCRLKNRERVRAFLREHLENLNIRYTVEKKSSDYSDDEPVNIFGEIIGTTRPDEIIEINAHYDTTHKGAPGADDNGSGLSLVIELARLFRQFPPERTVRIVFADLEEKGFQGTSHHVAELKRRGETLVGAFVIDMIGYSPKQEGGFYVVEVGDTWNFTGGELLPKNRALANQFLYQVNRFQNRTITARPDTSAAKPGTADHGPYWRSDYSALLIAAPYEGDNVNPNYHDDNDTIKTMNWKYYEAVARSVAEGIAFVAGASISDADTRTMFEQSRPELALLARVDLAPTHDFLPATTVRKPYTSSWNDEESDWESIDDLPFEMRSALRPMIGDPEKDPYVVLKMPYKTIVLTRSRTYLTYRDNLVDFIVAQAEEDHRPVIKFKENVFGDDKLEELYDKVRRHFYKTTAEPSVEAKPGEPGIRHAPRMTPAIEVETETPLGTPQKTFFGKMKDFFTGGGNDEEWID